MKRTLLAPLFVTVLFLGASFAHADSFVIAPNTYAATSGGDYLVLIGGESTPETFQIDFAASQLSALVGSTLTAVGFRLPSGAQSVLGSTAIESLNIQLSSSARPIGALYGDPQLNIGANDVQVRSGALTLGPLQGGSAVNPFFFFDFLTPYVYKGGDLLTTITSESANSLLVDAVDLSQVGNLADTDGESSGGGGPEFFNLPITAFSTGAAPSSVTPEPSSLLLLFTGLGIARLKAGRSRS